MMFAGATLVLCLLPIATIQALAANPYIAGFTDWSTNHTPFKITGKVTFVGSAPIRNNHFGGVISTSGWGTTAPTGWIYQSPITLYTYNLITADAQVWNQGVQKWYVPLGLGYFGTGPTNVDWIKHYFQWDAARTNVKFWYEVHFNDGTYVLYNPNNTDVIYFKQAGDTSTDFASGDAVVNIYPYGAINFKYLQFGLEGFGGTSTGYNVKQYGLSYTYGEPGSGTIKYLSSIPAKSTSGSFDNSYGSYISYTPGGGGCCPSIIGTAVWNSDACYNLDSGCSLPKGEVLFHQGGTPIPPLTSLWTWG